ncbi:MAG: hypothetical protein GX763_00690 [Clostridiaceae bacterium]|nr:hypothetical protein [Clostridiaceae bacterium]
MKKVKFFSGSYRQKKLRVIALWGIIVLVLAFLLFFLLRKTLEPFDYQAAYDKALEQSDFEEIISIHAQAQKIIADERESEDNSAELADAILIRNKIEIQLSTFAQSLIESVLTGNSLSSEEVDKLSLSMSIVGDDSLQVIEDVLKDYVLGVISEAEYIHFLETLYPVPEFKRFLSEQVNEFVLIRDFKTALEPAYQLLQQGEYSSSADAFESLGDSEYSRIRSLDHILKDLRMEALENLYLLRMPEIQRLIDQGRLYDASLIIKSIDFYFPDRDELIQAKKLTDKLVPSKLIYWSDPIEAISVKPIIADSERAFDNDIFADRANEDLLTAAEFRLLLEALYENDYVLINGNEIVDEAGSFRRVLIPSGKKPLLIFLDDFYFTPQRVESGICSRLDLDEDSNVLGVIQDRQGAESLQSNSTAIDILENFLQEYPDFTFNGAKAVIVLSGADGLFGYPLNSEHLVRMRDQAQSIGLSFYLNSVNDLEANRDKLREIFASLENKQWVFASQSYNRISVPDHSLSSLSWDTERMQEEIGEFISKLRIYAFAFGNHVEANPLLSAYLANSGFALQSGSGTPYAYTIQKQGYVYIDRQQITADKLRNPQANSLSNFVNGKQIITDNKRPY